MNDSIANKKQLIVCDILIADYLIEKNIIFIKNRSIFSDDIVAELINTREKTSHIKIAYLNIE